MNKPHRVRARVTPRKVRGQSRMRKNGFHKGRAEEHFPGVLRQLYWPLHGLEQSVSTVNGQRLPLEVMMGAGKVRLSGSQAEGEAYSACCEYFEAFVKFRKTPEVDQSDL